MLVNNSSAVLGFSYINVFLDCSMLISSRFP